MKKSAKEKLEGYIKDKAEAIRQLPAFDCPMCGVLMPGAMKNEHKCEPAKVFAWAGQQYKMEDIKKKRLEAPMESKTDVAVREEKQPGIIALMESPEKAVAMYDSIKKNFLELLKRNGEVCDIKGKDYVKYEGWQTIGTALGILPRIVEITKGENFYQAKAEAILVKTGAVVGSAYGICSRDEKNWSDKPEYAVMAMAQTRAAGRALKMILSGFVAHCGFEATPAEEVLDMGNGGPISEPIKHIAKETINLDGSKQVEYAEEPRPAGGCSEKQQKAIYAILKGQGLTDDELKDKLFADYNVTHSRELTKEQASEIITLYGKK